MPSNDVELTYRLFKMMGAKFPRQELKIIDLTLRMFIDPVLDLDLGLLEQHLEDTRDRKDKSAAMRRDRGQERPDVQPEVCEMLRDLGVEPPMKISPDDRQRDLRICQVGRGVQGAART